MSVLDDLRNYDRWIGKSPVSIRAAVMKAGGWVKVFPKDVPPWANRTRNYFNEKPEYLTRVNYTDSLAARYELFDRRDDLGFIDKVASSNTLSGDVYKCEKGHLWFETKTVGTIYHYRGKVGKAKKVGGFLQPQNATPVFKLISPDRTGGSREVCIHNWQLGAVPLFRGKSRIGDIGERVRVKNKLVIEPEYQGSYNFAEVVLKGLSRHDKMDVDPHTAMKKGYIDPPRGQPIQARKFPARDRRGHAIG